MLGAMRNFCLAALVATLCLCQDAADPWVKSEALEPAALAGLIKGSKPPTVICVAFPSLYNLKHISHASFAGPGAKPEGIEMLKKAVANVPKDADLVIYCGCCPMERCPNIRPAFKALQGLGFKNLRVLLLPQDFATDWAGKGLPFDKGN